MSSNLELIGQPIAGQDEIFTPEALAFLDDLVAQFAGRRDELLGARAAWQAKYDAGQLPDFRAETAGVRSADWSVAPLPPCLLDRRTEITGPTDRKMVINALNADVKVFMADFEDALSPTWANIAEGQLNLRDAVRGDISFTDETSGKAYALGDDPALLIARVRGLHLDEKNILSDGKPVPGAFVDFALYFHHNQAELLAKGDGPFFYVPKLEHYEEARLWADIFRCAETRYGLPHGTIKATVLIETLPAVFEMDEILFELKDHIAALNCGRWDYIFSYIKTLKAHPDRLLPDRQQVTMDKPFLDAYSRLLVRTCHKRGALAMGGMSAFIPRKDPEENAQVLEKVRADKSREAANGHDGSWVAHPGLAGVVNEVYGGAFANGQTNQLGITRANDAPITQSDLLAVPHGTCTEAGVRANIRIALHYLAAWLSGSGAVAIYGLMEDAATAEISRASIWQWIRHGAQLDTGEKMTTDLFNRLFAEEQETVRAEVGDEAWQATRYTEAAGLLQPLCLSETFETFLTLEAYRRI